MTSGLPEPVYAARFVLLAVFLTGVAVESAVSVWRGQAPLRPGLIAVNVGMWLVELFGRAATYAWRLALFELVASWAPVHLNSSLGLGVLTYVAVDFIYYWKHRVLHRTQLGWALHAPHHSSDELNLLAAIRLGWLQRLVDDFFFVPLALTGVPPTLLLFVVLANEVYPSWCHLGVVGRLGVVDQWLNTPENHRAHHSVDKTLADSNYASTFIGWDRLFGTWKPGHGVHEFGLSPSPGLNPISIQFGTLWQWLKTSRR